ncbi:hypothetical protein P261_02852 [Lachnospiraceae bacterium TWA4]|nr:hypothetical protein P261_02852 [Lachnospiraceae bacterium TWA4]
MSEELKNIARELSVEKIIEKYSIKEMLSELEEDAETAGFEGYYERVLKKMTEQEVINSFKEMIQTYQNMMKEEENRID